MASKHAAVVVLDKMDAEHSAKVRPDGYVDFGSYDSEYATQAAAVAALEAKGWKIVGYEAVR